MNEKRDIEKYVENENIKLKLMGAPVELATEFDETPRLEKVIVQYGARHSIESCVTEKYGKIPALVFYIEKRTNYIAWLTSSKTKYDRAKNMDFAMENAIREFVKENELVKYVGLKIVALGTELMGLEGMGRVFELMENIIARYSNSMRVVMSIDASENKIKVMSGAFIMQCKRRVNEESILAELDISNLSTSKCGSMHKMFENLIADRIIGIEGMDTRNVLSMNEMFKNCLLKEGIDLRSWDTHKVRYMSAMFYCASIPSIIMTGLDVTSNKDMRYVFELAISNRILLDKWDVSNVVSMDRMFYISKIEMLSVKGWKMWINAIKADGYFLDKRARIKEIIGPKDVIDIIQA